MTGEENVQKSDIAKREETILAFWKERDIFKKTLAKEAPKGDFIFYEGPPTANGRPGIHHLETRAFKDAIPRFRTMRGYRVRRKAGWDTHGLPVELEVEKELGFKNKKDIEAYGIAKFNQKCKESVLRYIDEWKRFTDRIGFWVDHSDTYFTFDNNYIESVWAILKHADGRKLLYKDYKVVPWCPRCETALSSHEVAQGYEDNVPDPSVYIKFKIISPEKIGLSGNVFLLAWTTTPWTLPGNVALAVNSDKIYVFQADNFIVAKDRVESITGISHEVKREFSGSELVGLEYESLFPYLANSLPESEKSKLKNAHKVYASDFVSTKDGTGIVHTAVMYGADDFELGTKVCLPKHHLVNEDGRFSRDAGEFAGKFVKDADEGIIANLGGSVYQHETILHTYPHCWRCKKPLIYYARDSWYLRMSEIKKTLIQENNKIHWEPRHIRDGRFGEWLRELKDWAISRSRFWGTPLPIWEASDGSRIVIGSKQELVSRTKHSGNRYFVMRHGEAESNINDVLDEGGDLKNHLTKKGRDEVGAHARAFRGRKIEHIIASPILRARETADIVAKVWGLSSSSIIEDKRLSEMKFGTYNGRKLQEWRAFFSSPAEKFFRVPEGAETYIDVRMRVGEALLDAEKKYTNATILFVLHDTPAWLLDHVASGRTLREATEEHDIEDVFLESGEIRAFPFVPVPRNQNLEPDFHRPYIDDVILKDEIGKEYRRVPEVLDVWFDSGAMPLAQDHYPFDTSVVNPLRKRFGLFSNPLGYPADFICEAIDQTRGWFYTLHAIGNIMGMGRAFKNVICLGHVLDAKGKKMSKSQGNTVEPNAVLAKYGADTIRYFMYSVNAPGDTKNFDERVLDEIAKKHIGRLVHVLAFYTLYKKEIPRSSTSTNVLDRWICARLREFVETATSGYETYNLDRAVRPLADFIDDMSTWYVRRSRDRFKEDTADQKEALATLRHVLYTLSCLMAPSMPFTAEHVFQEMRSDSDPESVHLERWPSCVGVSANDTRVIEEMARARRIVSLSLEVREKAGIKIRQPLQKLILNSQRLTEEYLELIKDEVNVKEIAVDSALAQGEVRLDTTLTPALKEEGFVRDVVRAIQDARKKAQLRPHDTAELSIGASNDARAIIERHIEEFESLTRMRKITIGDLGTDVVKVGEHTISIAIHV